MPRIAPCLPRWRRCQGRHGKPVRRASLLLLASLLLFLSVPAGAQTAHQHAAPAPPYSEQAWQRAAAALAKGDFPAALREYCTMFSGQGDAPLWTLSAILLCDPGQVPAYVATIQRPQPVFVQVKEFQGKPCYRVCAGVTRDRNEAVRWRSLMPEKLLAEGPFPVLITRPCEAGTLAILPPPSPPVAPPPPKDLEGVVSPGPPPAEPGLMAPRTAAPEAGTPTPAKRAEGEAWFQKGLASQSKGQRKEAAEYYRLAMAADPARPEVLNNLGVLCLQENRYEEAKGLFHQALSRSPKYARAHINLAGALWGSGERDGAIAEARKAVELDPTDVSAHLTLASFLLATGKKAEADEAARRVLLLDPENKQARALLAGSAGGTPPPVKP